MSFTNVHEFPILYGKDKNGKIKSWHIKVYNETDYSLIYIEYGYIDKKLISQTFKVTEGKNKGKRNATTHFTQALADAESKWTRKQTTNGFRGSIELLDKKEEVILPMLAHKFETQKEKIKFPCYIQPKLDGYRMTFQNGKCYSRTGKEFSIIKDTRLYDELCNLKSKYILDGELYLHDPLFKFENYGIARKETVTNDEDRKILEKLEYHVYDIIKKCSFKERLNDLKNLNGEKIRVVSTYLCNNIDDINKYHNLFIQDNYEGSMIRNADGIYIEKYRSYDLLKKKDFMDDEFKIVGYTSERGEFPLIIWICETKEGKEFKVQSTGTVEERKVIYNNADKYIGSKLWVKFQEYTADGIPRFPKTKCGGLGSVRAELL